MQSGLRSETTQNGMASPNNFSTFFHMIVSRFMLAKYVHFLLLDNWPSVALSRSFMLKSIKLKFLWLAAGLLSRPTTTGILLLTRHPWTPPSPREATTSHLHQVNPMKFEKNYWPMHANQNHMLPCGGYPGAIFLTGMLKEQYNIDAWSKLHAALRLDWGSSWSCICNQD